VAVASTLGGVRRHFRWIVLGALALAVVGFGIAGYSWIQQVQTSAESGKASLEAGVHALQAGDAASAHASFTAAEGSFTAVHGGLGPAWLKATPGLGRQLQAVDQLAVVGTEGAKAGQQMSALLIAASADPAGGINGTLKVAKPYVLAALDSFDQIAQIAPQLNTEGLLPPLANAMNSAKDALAPFQPVFEKSQEISTVVKYLLGSDHRFLLVSQNNAELRPSGGFMGSYGLLKVGPSGLKLERYQDIYTLPKDTLNLARPAGARMSAKGLHIQDANWWLDFPTSATTILKLYDHLQQPQPKVDGVVAIDLITVKTLLSEFGPITLRDYGKTITSENMIQTLVVMIEQTQWSAGQHRKDVLQRLSEELLHRILNIKVAELVPTGQMGIDLANQKRLLVFVRDAGVQQTAVSLGWAGAIDVPKDTTDLLAVDNAVVWPSKMNIGVHKRIDYQVSLTDTGAAQTQLTLSYAKDARRLLQVQRKWFGDYLRVYRPIGTTLTGWTSKRSMTPLPGGQTTAETAPKMTTDALGFPAITAGLGVRPGETRTEIYGTTVPSAITAGQASALPNMPNTASATGADLMHYRLLIVKQPDLEENQTTVTVTLPSGWSVAGTNAWRRASGEALAVQSANGQVTLSTPLTADTILDITMAKS